MDPETAVKEYQQVSTLLPPGTLVSYQLTAFPVIDFRSGYDPVEWSNIWDDFFSNWRELWFHQRIEPPSWTIAMKSSRKVSRASFFIHDSRQMVRIW